MSCLDVRSVDLEKLNSMTKYPSIPTYHVMDKSNGRLTDEVVSFGSASVIGTEKVDGTNARIVVLPDGSYVIGSREQLLYGSGDLVANPADGVVEALRQAAEGLLSLDGASVWVAYCEVYGGRLSAARQYTDSRAIGFRLFDVMVVPDPSEVLSWPRERIAAWRDAGGQGFLPEPELAEFARGSSLSLVPRLFEFLAAELPTSLPETLAFMHAVCPRTEVALDEGARGAPEGVVLRSPDRSMVAKARFADYDRAVRARTC